MIKVVSLFYLKDKKIYVAPDLTVCFSCCQHCHACKPTKCNFDRFDGVEVPLKALGCQSTGQEQSRHMHMVAADSQ